MKIVRTKKGSWHWALNELKKGKRIFRPKDSGGFSCELEGGRIICKISWDTLDEVTQQYEEVPWHLSLDDFTYKEWASS